MAKVGDKCKQPEYYHWLHRKTITILSFGAQAAHFLASRSFCEIVSGLSSIQLAQVFSSQPPPKAIPSWEKGTKAPLGRFNDSLYDRNFFSPGFVCL